MSMGGAVPVIWTVLVAAGEGRRFGGPKQLQPLGGRRVIDWALEPAASASDGVVVVAAADQVAALREGPGALAGSRPDSALADPEGVAGRAVVSGVSGPRPNDEPREDPQPEHGAGRAADSGVSGPRPNDEPRGSASGELRALADRQPPLSGEFSRHSGEGRNLGSGDTSRSSVVDCKAPGQSLSAHPLTRIIVTEGGTTRSESVRAGLAATPDDADVIVVHDAARPLATGALFSAVTTAVVGGADGAVPVVAVTDTIRRTDSGTLDRSRLRAVQTPQAFRADVLRRAHLGGAEATDDAALVDAVGGKIRLVEGERGNLKITEPGDLAVAEALLAARSPGQTPGAPDVNVPLVGIGFDVHRFSDDPHRALVLGGVTFEGERGLEGHSDADAVAHACCDAILGAAGLGDIGSLFPDDDDRWRGADSIALLAEAAEHVRRTGRQIGNIDCSVVAERPKLAPRRAEMQRRLSEAAGAPVTVRGKRAESLGALGRSEGIACWAVAVLA